MFRVKSSGGGGSVLSEQAFQKLMFNGRSFQRFSSHNSEVLSKYLTSHYPSHVYSVKNRTAQPHNPLNAQVSSHSNPGVNLLVPHQLEQYFVSEDYITNVLKSSIVNTETQPCVLPLPISTFQGGNNFSVPGGGLEPRRVYHISDVEGYEHYRDNTINSSSIYMSGGSAGKIKDMGCTANTYKSDKPLIAKNEKKKKKSNKNDDDNKIDNNATGKKKRISNNGKSKKSETITEDIPHKSPVESTECEPIIISTAASTIATSPSVTSPITTLSPTINDNEPQIPSDKSNNNDNVIPTVSSVNTATYTTQTPTLTSADHNNSAPPNDRSDILCGSRRKLMPPTDYSTSAFKVRLPRDALTGMFFQREEITDNLLSASRYFNYEDPLWIRSDHPQLHKFLKLNIPNSVTETVSLATHANVDVGPSSSAASSEGVSEVPSITLGLNSVVFAIEDIQDRIPTTLLHRSLHPVASDTNTAGAARRQSYDLSGKDVRRGMNACTGFVSMSPYFHCFTSASGDDGPDGLFSGNANKSGVWLSLDQIQRYQLTLKNGASPVMVSDPHSPTKYCGDVRCSWIGNGQLVEIEEWELYNSAQLAVPGRVSLKRAAIDDNQPPSLFE